MIEVEVLRARALHTAGRTDVALDALEHAVRPAEPHGWVRFFLDAGSSTRELLHLLVAREPASQYLRDLRAATADTPAADVAVAAAASPPGHAWEAMPGGADEPVNGQLIDSLSERELEVLRMLASELDGPGIARELVVSLNTVRTHTKHIYAKLGVNNRRAALTKAHRLGCWTVRVAADRQGAPKRRGRARVRLRHRHPGDHHRAHHMM